jgi:hypothetical protein
MSMAHPYPSLRSRIEATRTATATLPAGPSGVRPRTTESYAERYRGTEYSTLADTGPVATDPVVSKGRMFVLLSSAAVTVVGVVTAISLSSGA